MAKVGSYDLIVTVDLLDYKVIAFFLEHSVLCKAWLIYDAAAKIRKVIICG
jgi:hypothetical protein